MVGPAVSKQVQDRGLSYSGGAKCVDSRADDVSSDVCDVGRMILQTGLAQLPAATEASVAAKDCAGGLKMSEGVAKVCYLGAPAFEVIKWCSNPEKMFGGGSRTR